MPLLHSQGRKSTGEQQQVEPRNENSSTAFLKSVYHSAVASDQHNKKQASAFLMFSSVSGSSFSNQS